MISPAVRQMIRVVLSAIFCRRLGDLRSGVGHTTACLLKSARNWDLGVVDRGHVRGCKCRVHVSDAIGGEMTRISALLRAERVSAGRFAAIPLIVTALPSTASTMVAAATPPSTTDRRARHASSSSPICRSPLSQQHSFRTDTPAPIHITNGSSTTPSHSPGITLSPRRLSTSRSLAGSYTLSLLSSRMSAAHPTHHVPSAFTLKIGSVSTGRQVKSALRCPEHVKIAFDARWYELEGAGAAAWTP